MKLSQYYLPTLKEEPKEAENISHKLMIRAGMIRKVAAGIYDLLPYGLRVVRKVEAIVREEMNRSGAQEVLLPAVQPAELWEESGRWKVYGKELLRIKDRSDREFCFGPTHEEVIVDLVRKDIRSYKELPFNLYQIQTKFRDEIRPRFGLMRGREFIMKDSYSFHVDEASLHEQYEIMHKTYTRIFTRCGLNFRPVEADSGVMGGDVTHEFHVLADTGEDTIVTCTKCTYTVNREKAKDAEEGSPCPNCSAPLTFKRGIEVGQIFKLGTKYSKSMNFTILDTTGRPIHPVMGCYGIGIGRTAQAAIEQNHDDDGIIFPMGIAPFQIIILNLGTQDEKINRVANEMYTKLLEKNSEVLYDDREVRPGFKFKDADLIGIPIQIRVGKKYIESGNIEIVIRKEKKIIEVSIDTVCEKVCNLINAEKM